MKLNRLLAALVVAVAVALVATACAGGQEPELEVENSQAFCLRLRAAVGDGSAVNRINLADPASIDAAILQLGVVKEFAPPSITNDVDTVVDAFTVLVEALETPDNRSEAEVIAELSETLEEAATAGGRISNYAERECGVDLDPPPTPTPAAEANEEDIAPA